MSLVYVVTINGVFQMRGELTQATSFLISRYGSLGAGLSAGLSAGARVLPEWTPVSLEPIGSIGAIGSIGPKGPVLG